VQTSHAGLAATPTTTGPPARRCAVGDARAWFRPHNWQFLKIRGGGTGPIRLGRGIPKWEATARPPPGCRESAYRLQVGCCWCAFSIHNEQSQSRGPRGANSCGFRGRRFPRINPAVLVSGWTPQPTFLRVARHPPNLSTSDFWTPSRRLDRKKPSGRRAADAIAYTQTTCSTAVMPTRQSLAPNAMDKPCSPTWQTFTPTQPDKPGKKN
jgi:hypothetical protein